MKILEMTTNIIKTRLFPDK